MAVLLNSQSRVPRRSFSQRTASHLGEPAWLPDGRGEEQLERITVAPKPRAPFSNSRRVKGREVWPVLAGTEFLRRLVFIFDEAIGAGCGHVDNYDKL